MKEQSHKSEMSAAIRGDFERLRARRGEPVAETAPMPRPDPAGPVGPGEVADPLPAAEPEPGVPPPVAIAEPEPAPAEAAAPAPASPPAAATPVEPPRRSWLGRLRGRA